jgi:hypothetical protein
MGKEYFKAETEEQLDRQVWEVAKGILAGSCELQ